MECLINVNYLPAIPVKIIIPVALKIITITDIVEHVLIKGIPPNYRISFKQWNF